MTAHRQDVDARQDLSPHKHEERPPMSNDNLITDEIRATLARDDRIPHPAEVAISERDGTVTLRGSVGTPHRRRTIVEIARAVPGVRAVEDELRVDPEIAGRTTRFEVRRCRR
jgi:osmotically-inducible protein OsmY